ncbi:MAG: protein kinase [Myxococcales bacterium]|nr:protein kinase [Myxococcales bacterium]MCB9583000.1 protein kinase [Polyangiaceae bacterium]
MLDFEEPEELLGAVLDQRWRLSRVLGHGGLAVVYQAESLEGGPDCAVKILRGEFEDRPEIVERFLSELRASARVDHPGIARVFEAVRAADGTPYLVMELLEGKPLSWRMNRGRLPVEQAAAIAENMLDALAAAHAGGVVHRDLKPGNVFLLGDAMNGATVKILDFGIALVIDAAGGMQRKTRTGMLLGTPGYMSPEQIRSIKTTDPRADLWSVGIILYEMLSGRPAFFADNEFERITKVLNSDPTPIDQVAPQYAHWVPFFQRALARSAEMRFQTAREMAIAVRSVARGAGMPQPGASMPPQGSVPPQASAPYGSVPPETYGSAPQSPMPYGSAPPPSPAPYDSMPPQGSSPYRFGTSDTAVSPGSQAAPAPGSGEPFVEVVSAPRGRFRVPLVVAILLALVTGLVGFALGLLVARM